MVGGYVSGMQVFRQLQHAHRSLGEQLQSAHARIAHLESETSQTVQRRGEALLELSKHYLPDITRQTIASTFAEVRDELEDVLAKKINRERQLNAKWDQTLDRRAQLETKLDETTSELNELVELRETLEKKLAELLADDQQYQQLSERAVAAETELARNEQRVNESRREAGEKLPAYKKSRMFQYLLERGYGTPSYKKRGLTRRLDKWVAKLVDFHNAKQSYDFLRVTPEMMAAEVARRRAEFDGLMEQVEQVQRKHSDAIGLTDALERGVEAGNLRDSLVAKINQEQRERDDIESELKDLAGDRNEFYQQAVARMKRFLSSVEESALDRHARSTASRQDDALVDEVRRLGQEIDDARHQASTLRENCSFGQHKLAELGDVLRSFRANEFDGARSVFRGGFDPRPSVNALLAGELSKQAFWSELRRNQQFLPQWTEERWEPPTGGAMDNDFSYVLMRVLAEAAGVLIEHSARNGWNQQPWRTPGGHLGGPPAPRRRISSERPPSVRRDARGGFTRGRGF